MTTVSFKIDVFHKNEPYATACVLFLISFLFFYLFRIPTPPNVDTYLYARAIETFDGPGIHFGYRHWDIFPNLWEVSVWGLST